MSLLDCISKNKCIHIQHKAKFCNCTKDIDFKDEALAIVLSYPVIEVDSGRRDVKLICFARDVTKSSLQHIATNYFPNVFV